MDRERTLAIDISSCSDVARAWDDRKHPCHKVVNYQRQTGLAGYQRPEPWMGGLTTARVLFIASNPSISDDESDMREDYPTRSWSEEASAEFFIERFNPDHGPVYATFGHPGEPDFLTRSVDGEYRNGVDTPKKSQPTWVWMHNRASEILGEDIHPHRDWALTEVVHCKSRGEIGVKQAASHCSDRWLERIVSLSPAPILWACGSGGRDYFASKLTESPTGIGQGSGYASMSLSDRIKRDTFVAEVGGRPRVVIFTFRNGSSYVQRIPDVFGEGFQRVLVDIARGSMSMPKSTEALHQLAQH